jgi:hypothetical protein
VIVQFLHGSPAVITLEPTSDSEVEHEMVFTGAWRTPVIPLDDPNVVDDYDPSAYCCPTVSIYVDVASFMDAESVIPTPFIVDTTEPVAQRRKHVHNNKNFRASVQEMLLEAEVEGT